MIHKRPDVVGALLLWGVMLFAACGGGNGSVKPTTAPSTGSDQAGSRDVIDLARRLRGVDVPRRVDLPPPAAGDELSLTVIDFGSDDDPSYRTINATVRNISEHAYYLVDVDADIPDTEVQDAADEFEGEIWPLITGEFGEPALPGVDGDPRIFIVHTDLGNSVGGYVSGDDAFPTEAVSHSNGREALYINSRYGPLGGEGYARTVAHELQHLIHQHLDQSEDTWPNEGLSEYATALLGTGGAGYGAFLTAPDTQLNSWSDFSSSSAHYDAASLFITYVIEQAGGTGGELASEQADSVDGVRRFLAAHNADRSFEELAGDWAAANFLNERDGRYGYRDRELSEPATTQVDAAGGSGDVHQFGTDYLEIDAQGFDAPLVLDFTGDLEVPVAAAQRQAIGGFWWSGLGDSMDATLTRELDLSDVETATLIYRLWFDVERWFDYAHIEASSDGGATWEALEGLETADEDPLGVSFGPGYTGNSGGDDQPRWVEERIDLTPYVGTKVLVRWEYLTDDSNHDEGVAIDNIAVPEIGFLDDGSTDVGGWTRAGFRRVTAPLAQRFELRLITPGATPTVERIALDSNNRARIDLSGLGTAYRRAIIAVVGATDGTRRQARYRYEITSGGDAP